MEILLYARASIKKFLKSFFLFEQMCVKKSGYISSREQARNWGNAAIIFYCG